MASESKRESYEYGYGSPEGVEYGPPRLFLNKVNGDLWSKTTPADINTGWVRLLSTGGGGFAPPPPPPSIDWQQVYAWEGDPNGFVTARITLPCFCQDTSVGTETEGRIWWKTDGLLTNTGWY